MPDEVATWKAQQRTAMATQLQLEEESLARLEAAAAAKAAEGGEVSVHGIRQGIGHLLEEDEDEKVFDAPGLVKVRQCVCSSGSNCRSKCGQTCPALSSSSIAYLVGLHQDAAAEDSLAATAAVRACRVLSS
jgi:hypothetical protein